MLSNPLIQPHFDYAAIRFCLKLDKMRHISEEDLKTINWLPVDKRVQQSLNITVFKHVNNYMKEVFEYAS